MMRLVSGACCALAVLLVAIAPAHAALDEALVTSARDVSTMQVGTQTLRVRRNGDVTEYADAHGKIFAAKWRGFPDVRALFGVHYAAFQEQLQRGPRGLHYVHVQTPELDVSIASYGRFREGVALLRKSMPEGVTVDALR